MFATIPPAAQRLLVFARLPELGKVKTRLAATLGDERALAVYRAMLLDLLQSIGNSSEDLEIEIMWAPTEAASASSLSAAFGSYALAMQTGALLGDRLAMAFSERFFFHRTDKIIAIGVDDPRLSRETIDHAFALLDSCEWVLGPASDGGYYLIGCRAAAFDTEIFQGIEWGTSTVLSTTLGKIRALGSTLAMLPVRSDIDTADDLARFAAETASASGSLPELLRAVRVDPL
jgi:rSAM/selenodomain-associated transferase 1